MLCVLYHYDSYFSMWVCNNAKYDNCNILLVLCESFHHSYFSSWVCDSAKCYIHCYSVYTYISITIIYFSSLLQSCILYHHSYFGSVTNMSIVITRVLCICIVFTIFLIFRFCMWRAKCYILCIFCVLIIIVILLSFHIKTFCVYWMLYLLVAILLPVISRLCEYFFLIYVHV